MFADLGFEEALAKARTEKRIAVLDAMTSWCGPCKQMDATTWRDAGVVQWFNEFGVAVQLDMDLHVALKEKLQIKAFPTIVAFRDGVEFDRIVGSRGPAEFSEWLAGVRTGTTSKQRLAAQLAAARAAGADGYSRRRALVEDLVFGGELDEASTEYLWLWNNAAASGEAPAQERAQLAFEIAQVASEHAATLEAFLALRNGLDAQFASGAATLDQRSDWIALNVVVAQPEKTAQWAASVAHSAAGAETLRSFEERLFDLLVAQNEWFAAGVCLREPLKSVTWLAANLGAYDLARDGEPASMPAIPLIKPGESGGMKPAIPIAPAPGGASTGDAKAGDEQAPKSIPMIPLGGKPIGAAQGGMVPAIPMGAGGTSRAPQDPAEIAREIRERLTSTLRDMASKRYAALVACGRDVEAGEVARVLLSAADDAKSRAALVAKALRAGVLDQQRARHQEWLDQAAE